MMSGASTRVALVIAVFIVVAASPSASQSADKSGGQSVSTMCGAIYDGCMRNCEKTATTDYWPCTGNCVKLFDSCNGGPGAASSSGQTTTQPPKGKGLRPQVNVGPINQPTSPKGKVGPGQVNVGGVNQLGGGWGSPATSGGGTSIMRSNRGKKH